MHSSSPKMGERNLFFGHRGVSRKMHPPQHRPGPQKFSGGKFWRSNSDILESGRDGMADMGVLKTSAEKRKGSNPLVRTNALLAQ